MNFPPVLFNNLDCSYSNSSSFVQYQILCKKLIKFEKKETNFQSNVINWIKSLKIQQLIKYFSFKSQWFVDILHEMILISDSRQDLKYKFVTVNEKNEKDTSYMNLYPEEQQPKFSNYFNICDDEGLISLSRNKTPEIKLKKKFIDNIRYITLSSNSHNNTNNQNYNKKNEKLLYEYNNVVTLSYEYLSNIDNLLQTFNEISKKSCFKNPIEIETQTCKNGNKNYYNFKLPKWMGEHFSLPELLCSYFEISILINYQYFLLYKQEISNLYYKQFDELLENMYKLKEFITNSKDNVKIMQSVKPDEIKKRISDNQYIKKIILEKKDIDDNIRNLYTGKINCSKKHTMKTIINNTLLTLEKLFLNDKSNLIIFITFIKDSIIYTTEDFVIKIFYDIINNYWQNKIAEDLLLDYANDNPDNNNNNKRRKKKKKKKKEGKNDDNINNIEENKDNNKDNNNEKDLDIENNNNNEDYINNKMPINDNYINKNENENNSINKQNENEINNKIIDNINNIYNLEKNEEKKENENNNNINDNQEIQKNLLKDKDEYFENKIIEEKDNKKEIIIKENVNKNNTEDEIDDNNKKVEEEKQKNEINENSTENNHKKKKEKNFFLYPTSFKDKKKKNKQKKIKDKNFYNNNNIKEDEQTLKENINIQTEDINDTKNEEVNKNEIIIDKTSNRKNSDDNKDNYKKNKNGFDYIPSKQKNKFNMGMKLKNIIKDNSNLIIPKNFQPHDNSYNKLKFKNQSNINNNNIQNTSNINYLAGSNLPRFTSFNFHSNKKGKNYRNNRCDNNSPYNYISNKIIEFSNEIRENTIKVNTNKGFLEKAREKYIKKIYEIINIFLINEKVDFLCSFYGSSISGLSIEISDIDIMVKLKENKNENDYVNKVMNILIENFKKNNINYITNITPIFSASVPVIKIECNLCNDESFSNEVNNLIKKCEINYNDVTKLFFDITFFVVENEKNKIPSELMIDYIKDNIMIYPQIIDIIYIMKRFLINKKLNKSYQGGISSYSLFLLTLAFVKSFKNNYELPIGSLFIEYLNYYSNFDFYNTVIHPNNKDENIYLKIEDNQIFNKYNLNIIDPITGLNVAKSTFKIDQIQNALKEALDIIIQNLYNTNNDDVNIKNHKRILDNFLSK